MDSNRLSRCAFRAALLGTALGLAACRSTDEPEQEQAPRGDGATPPAPASTDVERALRPEQLELPPGFSAELLYSVPRATQGSWVSLCADDAGRLYASDQYGGLWRVTPPPARAADTSDPTGEVRVEAVDVELGEAQGLLWAFGALYVVVNSEETYESGLYRLTDTDGDGALDAQQLLRSLDGRGEHGPHALALTPDGTGLMVAAGNHTALPEPLRHSRVPRVWEEDAVLARIDDPNGHAVGITAPGGWICRTDPEGREWELFASGLRNAYDLACDPSGEWFTFDSDMEWDIGLPWYRPTRILHLVSGAEFGWRSGSAKWPAFVPDSLGSVADVGLTSPTGVAFGTDAHFPERWRRALYAADWAYGKIYAVHLEPDGASYAGSFEPFVQGTPLPVTDLEVMDGALYFTTGGRRTQSGLYRVTWSGPGEALLDDLAPELPTGAARRRRALEALHAQGATPGLEPVWEALDDADRGLRFAARTALELRPPAEWRTRALAERRERASIEALLALVRCDDALSAADWSSRTQAWPWESADRERRLAALRVVGLGLLRIDGARESAAPLAERLRALLPTGDDLLDRELVRVLARLQCADLPAPALQLLESAGSQQAAVHHAYALSTLRTGWTDASRARFLRWFDDEAPNLAGGVSFADYLREMRALAVRSLGSSLPTGPAAGLQASAPAPTVEPAPTPAAFVRAWTVADLEPELARLTSPRSLARGREVYARARCLECHRIDDAGGSSGPDLTGAGGRFSPRDLLQSLLEPSATVSDQYRDIEVWTTGGGVVVGRVVAMADARLTIRTPQDERVEIRESEIESRRPHPLSRMPEGLLDTCSTDEILDLLAYLIAGGSQ